jgi:hypothetical protein
MQSITVNKEELFVFHFYDTYLEIERKGEATKKIGYDKVKSCALIKGKPEILATIFVGIVSGIAGRWSDIKIFKKYDQLLIALQDKKLLSYPVNKDYDKDEIHKIIVFLKQRKNF